MDNQKDSHNLKIQNEVNDLPFISIYSLDKKDDSIRDKIERLSAVVYLATNHIKDIDPIKLSLREACTNCLKTINDTSYFMTQNNLNPQFSDLLISDLNKIVSFFRVLSISGFISKNNFEVISGAVSVILDKSFKKEDVFTGKNSLEDNKEEEIVKPKFSLQKIEKGISQNKNIKDKSGRRDKVLSLIKKHEKVATKDITDYFPTVSDKTIQRELNKLVSEGLIKRQGKKRWSFYSMN